MCSHYEAPETQRLIDGFGVAPEGQFKMDLWPCYEGPFIRLRDTCGFRSIVTGRFG